MNAERLLQHYEQIADAPDAIARLRQFILDLAVRGKLVPQEPADEPASELLKRIAKAKLARKRNTDDARIKITPDPAADELGISIPTGWAVQSFENLFLFIDYRGNTPAKTDAGIPLITAKNIRMGYINREPREYISEVTFKTWMTRGFPKNGDLFFTTEAPLANVCLNDIREPFALAQRAICFQPYGELDTKFVMFALMSRVMQSLIDKHATGMTAKGIKAANLKPLPIPIPPLAEQHRIVAKVDELMALCEELEAARMERETKRDRLTAASLARLNTPDPETFRDDARFALDALPALTARPDQIKQLRQTVLNLAVRGKLVPQDPADEPAEELLRRIAALTPRSNEPRFPTPTFVLPSNWSWTSLGQLVHHSDAGWSPKTEDYPRRGTEWGVLKVSAVSWDAFRPEENKQVLPGTAIRQQAVVRKGDFLISRANTAQLIARAVIVDDEPLNLMMSDKIVRLALRGECVARYVWIVNNYADFARQHYIENASGVSPSMKNVSRPAILGLPFPLPPLAEQHRIVAKVNELMALCDQLETSLTSADETRKKLLDALLAEALVPEETLALQEAAE